MNLYFSFICGCDVIVLLFLLFLIPTGPKAFGRHPGTLQAEGRPTLVLEHWTSCAGDPQDTQEQLAAPRFSTWSEWGANDIGAANNYWKTFFQSCRKLADGGEMSGDALSPPSRGLVETTAMMSHVGRWAHGLTMQVL